MKKAIFKTSMVVASTFLSTILNNKAAAEVPKQGSNGFFIATQLAYNVFDSKVTRNYLTAPRGTDNSDFSGRGVLGGLELGWGRLFNKNLYLGVSLHGALTTAKGSLSMNPTVIVQSKLDLKQTNALGAAVYLGWVVSGIMPYLKIGVTTSRWNLNSTSLVIPVTMGIKKQRLGGEVGMGVEVPLSDRVTLAGEYTHTQYQKLRFEHTGVASYSVRPTTNTFGLRLKYTF